MLRLSDPRAQAPVNRLSGTLCLLLMVAGCAAPSPSKTPAQEAPGSPAEFAPAAASVLYVSVKGSDANAGTSSALPLRTLSAAARLAGPGTTVHVLAGTYFEPLVTEHAGKSGAPLTFEGEDGAILDGSQLSWTKASNQNQGLVELRHPYVRLTGFKIAHSKNSGIVLAADHLRVEACEVFDVQRHAISTDTTFQTAQGSAMIHDVTLEGNRVHDATLAGSGYGQAISLIADGFTVADNQVHDNGDIGIDVWLGSRHGEVVGNTVFHNVHAAGIYVDGAAYVRIDRNRVYGNQNGILVSSEDPHYDTHHIWVYENLVYDHAEGCGCGIWDPDVGAQQVLFAGNTLFGNRNSFQFAGSKNSAAIVDNLGYATADDFLDQSQASGYDNHDNTWLVYPMGFVSTDHGDFHLTPSSLAIGKGKPLPTLYDDLGGAFAIRTDFDQKPRASAGRIDAGAFQALSTPK